MTADQRDQVLRAIRERCVEEGDCLLWTGAHSRGQGSNRPQPAIWIGGKTMPLRRLAYVAYGKELIVHMRVSISCGNDSCLCEDHLKRKTHSESLRGHRKSALTSAKIALAKQAQSPLDWDKVRAIRLSELTDKELGQLHHVHPDTIGKIRQHVTWREVGGFFSGLMPKPAQAARP